MTDVLELLKQADPADVGGLRGETPPGDRLDAILASAPSAPSPSSPEPPRRRRSRAGLLAPAAGLAAAVAATVVLVAGGDGRNVDTAAAAALEKIADTARAQPPTLPPGDDRFLYFRLETKGFYAMESKPPFLLDFRSTQEAWVGEGNGLVRNAGGEPTFASPRDRRAWEDAGRPKLPPAHDEQTPTNTGIERLRLPADPDALLDRLRERAVENGHGNAWIFGTLITDYLREWGVTPEQRATLFQAAARLPGVTLLGDRTDPEGRAGVGFAMVDEEGHTRETLIVDPATGELLAQLAETLPGGPIRAGAKSHTVFHSPTLVAEAGVRP